MIKLFGSVTEFNDTQLEKALSLIIDKFVQLDKSMEVNDEHALKALLPIASKLFGKTIEEIDEQYWKALVAIEVILSGIRISPQAKLPTATDESFQEICPLFPVITALPFAPNCSSWK